MGVLVNLYKNLRFEVMSQDISNFGLTAVGFLDYIFKLNFRNSYNVLTLWNVVKYHWKKIVTINLGHSSSSWYVNDVHLTIAI